MKFRINGEEFEMISERFTFAEAAAMEAKTDLSIGEIIGMDPEKMKSDVLRSMIWISMKRKQPTILFGDLDDVGIDEIEWDEPETPEGDVPPTQAAPGDASGTSNSDA